MKSSTRIPLEIIARDTFEMLRTSIPQEYAESICSYEDETDEGYNAFIRSIRADVEETSAWNDGGYYCLGDVGMAIGRTLISILGIAM